MVSTVSAALIVRDEERFLAGCLESLTGHLDEVIVVDTGSTDRTREIAAAFGARILHHPWTGDFAAARNTALDAVSSAWVLYIDADERLNLPRAGQVADYLTDDAVAGFVRFRPKTGYTRYREWRLFRCDPRIRFEGKIHETVVDAILRVGREDAREIMTTEVEINHLGYDGAQGHKHVRNLPLLRDAVKTYPDRIYLWMHLAETLAAIGDLVEARKAAAEGLIRAEGATSDKDRAAASMIRQFLARDGMAQGLDTLALIEDGLAKFPADLALVYLKGCAVLNDKNPAGALQAAHMLLAINPAELSDGLLAYDSEIFGKKAFELAALASLQLGNRQEAASYFAHAAKYAAAA